MAARGYTKVKFVFLLVCCLVLLALITVLSSSSSKMSMDRSIRLFQISSVSRREVSFSINLPCYVTSKSTRQPTARLPSFQMSA